MHQEESKAKESKEVISKEEIEEIKEMTTIKGKNFRGIRDDVLQHFLVRNAIDEAGEVISRYYPCTQDGQLTGYKVRDVPKDFRSIARTGATCEMFMQFRFSRGGKYVLIVEGEEDSLAAFQMLKDYYVNKGSGEFEVAVVSPTTGAQSVKQIQAQYKFLDSFDQIVLAFDSDKAGQEAQESVIKVLPKGKTKIMKMRLKDPNEYLKQNKESSFVTDFFAAKTYVPAGVVGSSELYEKLLEGAAVEKVPLPPFMKKLDEMIGSIELGTIGIFAAGSGAAKCLAPDTIVLMHDFSKKKVQDVVLGDKVIGPDGKPRNVLSVSSGYDQMYRVDQVKGISYTVNSAHILSLRCSTSRAGIKKGDIRNVNVKDYYDGLVDYSDVLKGYKADFTEYSNTEFDTEFVVTSVGEGQYFGFTLDGDHLFCLEDGTVTHNTTVANELLYFWLFNSPHKIGVVSLELTCAQYAQAMLSRHLRNKISLIKDVNEKVEYLKQDRIREKAQELFLDEQGNDRFMLIDERDGSVEVLQDKIEELVISCGCKVIVLDPLSDIMDSLSIDEQAKFMKWCKSIIKNYNVTFLMIAHIRKSGNNKDAASTGAFIPEEAITGSSTIFKSASWVVMMMRDKYNEDAVIRNTTNLVLSKNRTGGETGPAGALFYDNQTHTLHELDAHLNGDEFS